MKSKIGWILAIVLGAVILFFLPSLFMGRFWSGGYYGMMGPGMMGGYGYQNPFSFFGMTFMWLLPVGLLVVLVIGAVALVNNLVRPEYAPSNVPEQKCANCGKSVQADWATCPYCGKSLH